MGAVVGFVPAASRLAAAVERRIVSGNRNE